jgi:hypothetical protein
MCIEKAFCKNNDLEKCTPLKKTHVFQMQSFYIAYFIDPDIYFRHCSIAAKLIRLWLYFTQLKTICPHVSLNIYYT